MYLFQIQVSALGWVYCQHSVEDGKFDKIVDSICFVLVLGVLLAVDAVVSHLKEMSRNVTTPEEIAQVFQQCIV